MSNNFPPRTPNNGEGPQQRTKSSPSYTPDSRAARNQRQEPRRVVSSDPKRTQAARAGAQSGHTQDAAGSSAPGRSNVRQQPDQTRVSPAKSPVSSKTNASESAPEVDTSSKAVGKSSLLMASGTAVSRVLGLVRNIMLVAALGATGAVADAFDIANKIPNILFAIIAGGALNAVIVPQVMKAYKSKNPQERLDKLLTLAASMLFGITLLLTLGASLLVSLYTTGWSEAQIGLAVSFAFWCIPQLFFYGLYTLLGQVLNARGQFGPYMWAPALNNVVSIIGFGAFLLIYGPIATGDVQSVSDWSGPSISLIGASATLGVVSQALILLVPLYRSGFRWNLRFGIRGIGLRSAGRVGMWTFLAIILDQIGVLVFSKIATAAPDAASAGVSVVAGNASYTQALMIYLLPHSLVTVSVATALFTGMSSAASKNDTDTVSDLVSRGLRVIAVFTIFATAVFLVLSGPLTKLLIPSLTAPAVEVVSQVVWALAWGLMPLGAMVLMKWVYFAFEDGKSVFYFQVPVTLVLIAGSFLVTLVAPGQWWVFGIALSMSASNLVCVLLRMNGLRKKLPSLNISHIVRLHVQLIVAAAIAALVGWTVLQVWSFETTDSFGWAFTVTAIVGILMVAVYVLTLQLMKIKEFDSLLAPIIKKISQRSK